MGDGGGGAVVVKLVLNDDSGTGDQLVVMLGVVGVGVLVMFVCILYAGVFAVLFVVVLVGGALPLGNLWLV